MRFFSLILLEQYDSERAEQLPHIAARGQNFLKLSTGRLGDSQATWSLFVAATVRYYDGIRGRRDVNERMSV
jgi:hypothetical protein